MLVVKPLKEGQSWFAQPSGHSRPNDQIMIRNGLYLAETTFLDGVDAYNRHVMILRDGTMRGGGSEATLVLAASGRVK